MFPKALIWVVTLSILFGVVFFAQAVQAGEEKDGRYSFDASAKAKKIALIYDGIGACPDGCAVAAAASAKAAGFQPKIVGPQALLDTATTAQVTAFFKDVAVWVQPGGKSRQAFEAMTNKLKQSLVDWVRAGGGYVGFCAGAFLSTPIVGSTGTPGLALFPAKTWPLNAAPEREGLAFSIEKLNWLGRTRYVYFEGGPYIYDLDPSVEVIATFKNGLVAAARARVGLGKVFLSGPHPEAPLWWSQVDNVTDADGLDQDLSVSMITWAAAQ